MLLACGAPLFVKNIAKQTPLDAAMEAKQTIIANFLESKMVFSVSVASGDPMNVCGTGNVLAGE